MRPFEELPDRYEAWFERNRYAFESERAALAPAFDETMRCLEVGVGTGRFAQALGIQHGLEPARAAARRAAGRGIHVVRGVGERLPYATATFDRVLVVVTLCYLEDPERALAEARRVLAPGGRVVVGAVDRDSRLGERYVDEAAGNPFYAPARFYTVSKTKALLEAAGLRRQARRQTLFTDPERMRRPDPVREDTGEGAFFVLEAAADG